MNEVNDKFPILKYRVWAALPHAVGSKSGSASRADSISIGGGIAVAGQNKTRPTAEELCQFDGAGPASQGDRGEEDETQVKNETQQHINVDGHVRPHVMMSQNGHRMLNAGGMGAADVPPSVACAICIDILEGDDDIRGLSCGHAFHVTCVDPWLTRRRACCPLCKEDYYAPILQLNAADDNHNFDVRSNDQYRLPRAVPAAWFRDGNAHS